MPLPAPDPVWLLPQPLDSAALALLDNLRRHLRVSRPLAEILLRRGHTDAEATARFLHPRLAALADPSTLPGLDIAADRLALALQRGEKIALYGDYDVDGVASLAILLRTLRALGARDPAAFLPHRMDEGYGLSTDGLDRCLAEHQPALLLAADCGTSSHREAARLRSLGVDLLILDHHEPPPGQPLPDCVALVNPKLAPGHPLRNLCTAGLALKLAQALLRRVPAPPDFDLKNLLDLAALATVADIVPLEDDNRILVRHGLRRLANSPWPGLRALISIASLNSPLTAADIAFRLAPRLNAAGRLGPATAALRLLLTDDPAEAAALARDLHQQNAERQNVEKELLAQADALLPSVFDPANHHAIVIGADGWHPGVLGIVAARLVRAHWRPALVIGFDPETGLGKGSGRSLPGLSLVSALADCAPLLEKFGGHDMAAGLSLRRENLEAFRADFLQAAANRLTPELLRPRITPDAELHFADLSDDGADQLLADLDLLQPCGQANPAPLLLARQVRPSEPPRVMKEKHLKFNLLQSDGSRATAVWFNAPPLNQLPPSPWDLALRPEPNTWNGQTSLQFHLVALRSAE